MSVLLVAAAVGYLVGAFPTAYLFGKLRGKDVFAVGSGSMGAMNTARNLGTGLGVLVLAVDVAKGALAAFLGSLLLGLSGVTAAPFSAEALLPPLLAGFGAVTGHCFSAYVSFRGGQGMATALGAALPVYPVPALYTLVLIVALVLITKRGGGATLVTLALYPVVTLLALDRQGWPREATFLVTTVVAAMCVVGFVKQVALWRARRQRGRDLPPDGRLAEEPSEETSE